MNVAAGICPRLRPVSERDGRRFESYRASFLPGIKVNTSKFGGVAPSVAKAVRRHMARSYGEGSTSTPTAQATGRVRLLRRTGWSR